MKKTDLKKSAVLLALLIFSVSIFARQPALTSAGEPRSLSATEILARLVNPGAYSPHDYDCPDGKVICPGQRTCCVSTTSGADTCSYYQNAVCCDDGVHSCPTGNVCTPDSQYCYAPPSAP